MIKMLITIHFFTVIILIALVLLQKSGEDGSLFSKVNQNKVDKTDSNIIKITIFFIILFILNSLGILYIKNSEHIKKFQQIEKSKDKKFDQNI
jgi:protein translocase SecG subunit